jgi:hypothetical protein
MKGEAMDMITIHTTTLGMTPPQHSVFCMEAQAMAMTIYSPYHTAGNDPHPSFGMAHEGRSYGYDYGPHNTASDIPPPTFGYAHEQPSHYSDHNPYYVVTNNPPPTFYPHVTSRDREEEEFQRQLEEATRHSQADYTRKLEEDNRFYNMQWDTIHQLYPGPPSGPGGPSRRFDETDSDSDYK